MNPLNDCLISSGTASCAKDTTGVGRETPSGVWMVMECLVRKDSIPEGEGPEVVVMGAEVVEAGVGVARAEEEAGVLVGARVPEAAAASLAFFLAFFSAFASVSEDAAGSTSSCLRFFFFSFVSPAEHQH